MIYMTEKEIIQCFLDWGLGIIYEKDIPAGDRKLTSEAEIESAKKDNKPVRYVSENLVFLFLNYHRQDQLAFAAEKKANGCRMMDWCDFEDWQWIQDALGITMPYSVSKKIENILFELFDDRVIAIDLHPEAQAIYVNEFKKTGNLTMTSAVSYALCPAGLNSTACKKIADILQNELGIDVVKLIEGRLR